MSIDKQGNIVGTKDTLDSIKLTIGVLKKESDLKMLKKLWGVLQGKRQIQANASGLNKFKAGAKVHIIDAYYGMAENIVVNNSIRDKVRRKTI